MTLISPETPRGLSHIAAGHVKREDYKKESTLWKPIDGVVTHVIGKKFFYADDGWFNELLRLEDGVLGGELGEIFPGFTVRQVNESYTLDGQVKGFHMHTKQDEIWVVPPKARVIVGAIDLRDGSSTMGNCWRYVMRGDTNKPTAIYFPRLVAHGLSPLEPLEMRYIVNNQFDGTDEYRFDCNFMVGDDFWKIPNG